MKYFAYCFLAIIIFFTACQSDKKFEVVGTISSAENKILYLEHHALNGVQLVDSVKVNKKGKFKFKVPAFQNPEFYQLRMDNQIVVFCVDSAEKISISADFNNLFETFTVIDSPENKLIKDIMMRRHRTASQITAMGKAHAKGSLSDEKYLLSVDSLLSDYKAFATKIIMANPASAVAYYAVFQKIDNYLIFNPYDKKDFGMYGAVATAWNTRYPETSRSRHLYQFSMNALKYRKQSEKNVELVDNLQKNSKKLLLNDIVLPDLSGKDMSLKELKGKVVLLDFAVYSAKYSPQHNILLNDVYQKLKNKGLQIYQIAFDSDEHFWKNTAANLPWVCVRDAQSVASALLRTYNIREFPSTFVLNRDGDIILRIKDYSTLGDKLSGLL